MTNLVTTGSTIRTFGDTSTDRVHAQVLDLDDSPTVLRNEEVDGPVSVVVSFPCVLHCSRPGISPWRAA